MLLPGWLDPEQMLESLGPWALIGTLVIVFAECGLLVGFFLPGDSLLFTVGLLTARGSIDTNIAIVCALISVAAVAGNFMGYWIGHKAGPAIFNRPDSRLFRKQYVDRTRTFFDSHGARAIILARFLPIVRTFITVMAGAAGMKFRDYAIYTTIGGVVWATGVTLLGYYLGQRTFVQQHIELILIAIVVVSLVPVSFELLRHRAAKEKS
ncbi:MAG: VTT domain-containing protein [Candidatus Nanopelagicales bacterium]